MTLLQPGRRAHRVRRGFTLIEMMIAIVLTVLVMGALMTALVRQQRFYTGAARLLDARSQVRQAAAILPADIRALSSVGNDILTMGETELAIRATYGSSIICAINGGNIIVPPVDPALGNVVTYWAATPATGDEVLIFNDGPTENASDDSWILRTIGSLVTWETGSCPTSTGLTTASDAAKSVLKFNVVGGLPADVKVGAPMRYVRNSVYRLFEASNGEWYLGYCSPDCGGADPDVVAGPFVPVGGQDGPGVRFTYFDNSGAETAVASEVSRISILVSARTRPGAGLTGFQTSVLGDSLRLAVAIRNQQ